MSEYVDTKLLNCNRLASVQSNSGNDSNPALFTNTLRETIKLDVGDKISLERAFVNEIGAANPQTIEFKGKVTGSNPVSTYTNINFDDHYYKKSTTYDPNYRLGYYRSITTTEVSNDEVELRDNLAPLVIGYFITSNEYPNYLQQPRRFVNDRDTRGPTGSGRDFPDAYSRRDSIAQGLPLGNHSINLNCICFDDWVKREGESDEIFYKLKVDNTRYTLYVKNKVGYTTGLSNGNDRDQFPTKYHNGIFQEGVYYRVREKIDIEVNKGFNTPSAVANQITKTLTETKNENIFQIYDADGFTRTVTKTIETNTYKPINAQNIYNLNRTTYAAYTDQVLPVTAENISQDSVDYISTFGYIGVKRPEIFDKGRYMHEYLSERTPIIYDSDGVKIIDRLDSYEGFQTIEDKLVNRGLTTLNQDQELVLNIPYNEDNLKVIRDFFDAQALYPELWDNLQDTVYFADTLRGVLHLPEVTNSRFFHINKYPTRDINSDITNETFGDDAFTQRPAPNNIQMTTTPLFFKYDDSQRDTFYQYDFDGNIPTAAFSYGFAKPFKFQNYNQRGQTTDVLYLIKIKTDGIGGIPVDLYTEDTTLGATVKGILQGRRIGYDFHSTAYSTAIITPYSGYANTDIGITAQREHDSGGQNNTVNTYPMTINWIRSTGDSSNMTDLNPYMTQTYIGANNPEISYNTETNRFELQRFHTSNNTGNKASANNPATFVNNNSMTPPESQTERDIKPATINDQANQTVYKINPRPPEFGFSPTFKPYFRNSQAYRTVAYPEKASALIGDNTGKNTNYYEGRNINIEALKIFDSHGGIYIDNWGFDESNWEDNLWDILGFDYYATNAKPSPKNVLTKRVTNDNNDLLYRPTTNAEIVGTDTKNYITNQFGAVMYQTSLPYPNGVVQYRAEKIGSYTQFIFNGDPIDEAYFTVAAAQPLELFSEINILTVSTRISATDLKKSVLRPYYTIRSDILEGATAIGGNPTGANLPIISIVDKYSAANDYFLGNPSGITFTVTKPSILTDITTSIHDSDGNYANVDKTSAVIYKIEKIRNIPKTIVEEILEEEKKQNKKKK